MRHVGWFLALALTFASVVARTAPPTPIVVELFTSEGCSDCPPADTLLEKLAATQPVAGAEIIALGEHVDYWDRLGWKDRFSSAAVTGRQQGYQARFGTESIYTPQMVVDGRAEFVGSDATAAHKAIERSLKAPHGVIALDAVNAGAEFDRPIRIRVSATDLPTISPGDHADIVLLITESGLKTDVKRGENHGRTLSHAPVVRYMATIGQIAEGAIIGSARADFAIAADWQRDRLTVVSFVQEVRSRAILAAAAVPLKNAHP
jgi:hypothetical protein